MSRSIIWLPSSGHYGTIDQAPASLPQRETANRPPPEYPLFPASRRLLSSLRAHHQSNNDRYKDTSPPKYPHKPDSKPIQTF